MQSQIRRAALRLLTRRDYSHQGLIKKLLLKGYPAAEINLVCDDLVRIDLINDVRFVEHYIRTQQHKGYGPMRIQQGLKAHGICASLIAQGLKITDNAWFTEAHAVWKKRFKRLPTNDFKERARQMRFLQYRGFTHEQIEQVFRSHDKLDFSFNENE